MRGRYTALVLLAIGVGFAGGYALNTWSGGDGAGATDGPEILYWVAPMDPNFRKDGPGKSPMGMDLIPVYAGQEASAGPPDAVTLSPAEVNTIGVRSAVAQVEDVAEQINTVGFVDYDEYATTHIHMRVEGWIEDLKVRAAGDAVTQGDLLFELYAPEITIASAELQRAAQRNNRTELRNAQLKLKHFGVSDRQIKEMATEKAPSPIVRVYAPQNGVVTLLNAADGMYLTPDTRAMTLSDLSAVWVMVDVFERDIGHLSKNMHAQARFNHMPGKVFEGEIDYIFPELDPETRTLKVRLRFDNPDNELRPNMFANVSLIPDSARQAITVPSEAVIRTGRAERVILQLPDGSFRPRLVTTGLRGGFGDGTRTEIVQGLKAGDQVVASAQFLIDSESALSAGMMRFAPTAKEPAPGQGTLISLDPATQQAVIAHAPIDAMGWPAMETRFTYAGTIDTARLQVGDAVRFQVVRGADGLLSLSALHPDDGIEATGTGIVRALTEDGKLSLSHDPIPALNWPAMEMDMPVRDLDLATVPLDQPVSFDLAKDDDGMFVIVAVRPEGDSADHDAMADKTPKPKDSADDMSKNMSADMSGGMAGGMGTTDMSTGTDPITVTGTINSVDVDAQSANISHGPIKAIGMMGMTMDFTLAEGVDAATLPIGQEVDIHMTQGDGMMLVVTGVEEAKP